MSENHTALTATPTTAQNAAHVATPAIGRLLGHQRRARIVDQVRLHGAVRVRELTEQFGVSDMTIRRDIETLDAENLVRRVHGGAAARPDSEEPGFRIKSFQQIDEKRRIAEAASRMVKRGQAIGITGGTTTFQLVDFISQIPDLTVVTNSLPVATALHATNAPGINLLLTGGAPTPSDALVGPVSNRSLTNLHLDHVFMGVHGMGEATGFTAPTLAEEQTNTAFITAAANLVVLTDSTKWGLTGLCSISPLAAADHLVTDSNLMAEARLALTAAGVDVMVV